MKQLPFWPGAALIAISIPAIFWIRYGRIDGFALGITGFLLLIAFSIQFIPKLSDRYGADQEAQRVLPGRFDKLGVVWLLAIPFAPFAMWLVGSLATIDSSNWRVVLGIKAFLCVAIPVVCVLPLLRYIRGKAAPYGLLILFLGTMFPVSVGWASTADLLEGPEWQTVVVRDIKQVHMQVRMRDIPTRTIDVHLEDGRVLQADKDIAVPLPGTSHILVLNHLGLIIATRS